MRHLLLTIATLTACTTTPGATMQRSEACDEQATAWCSQAGFPTPGCRVWYLHAGCEQHGTDGVVSMAAQDACLDAIADNPNPTGDVPAECRLTWN